MKKVLIILLKSLAAVLLLVLTVTIAFSFSPIFRFEEPKAFSGPDIFNPYRHLDTSLGWKRANFHTHTRVKGPFNECPYWPDTVYSDYLKMGYDIVTFSNHNKLTTHPYDTALQVNVYEHGYNLFKFHKLVFGANKVRRIDHIVPLFPSEKQFQLDMLAKGSDFLILNHPDRTNFTTKRCMQKLTGYRLMEGDSGVNTEFLHWDEALSAGHYSFGIANDDNHDSRRHDRFARRCSFLNCEGTDYEAIRSTLLDGCFYSMRVPDFGDGDWEEKYRGNATLPRVDTIGLDGTDIFLALSEPAEYIKVIGQDHATLDSVVNTASICYGMKDEDSYARISAFFPDGTVIYTQPFARFDASSAESPYRVSPHNISVAGTLFYNLAVLAALLLCCFLFYKLLWRRD